MDNFSELVNINTGLKELLGNISSGRIPPALSVRVSRIYQERCALALAVPVLCNNFKGNDGCASCVEWHDDIHPDIIISGTPDKGPGIDRCREMQEELTLKPVSARRRVAVIYGSDRLSLQAANSLLKIAEEPPANTSIIFLLEEDNLLPTLRSRVWSINISRVPDNSGSPVPESEEQWIRWLEESSRWKLEEFLDCIEKWVNSSVETGNIEQAGKLEKLRIIAKNKKISNAMLEGLVLLTMKEGIPFEYIFSDLW